nr:immunoglobulin heavy chain junction region [Macaca mulatta]
CAAGGGFAYGSSRFDYW